MIWFGDYYIRSEEDSRNPYVAPLRANDLRKLPPAYVVTAENDVLRDEGKAYAERLKEAGVSVESVCAEGLVHGYFTTMAHFPEQIKDTILKISDFLNKVNTKEKTGKK